MEECLEQFFRAIHSRYDIEKPVPRRLIRRKLGIINTLKEQNKKLKDVYKRQALLHSTWDKIKPLSVFSRIIPA